MNTLLPDRFWAKVTENPETGCWDWTGSRASRGYGRFWADRFGHPAHRLAWEERFGPVPDGLVLDHLCRNRGCVNPDHLEPVTNRVNLLRGEGIAAAAATATSCPQGHDYTARNTYTRANGHRVCKTCHRARVNARAAGMREELREKNRAYRASRKAVAA